MGKEGLLTIICFAGYFITRDNCTKASNKPKILGTEMNKSFLNNPML